MALAWSTIFAIIYFSSYTILLFIVGFIVHKQGTHDTVISRSYAKDVWAQRKIYLAVLVHFYDTATDIGVLIVWYKLMQDELNGINYTDVNMVVYFWAGFTFMILFRCFQLIYVIAFQICSAEKEERCSKWYNIILAILDLYILVTVYESFTKAQAKINERQQNIQKSIDLSTKTETNEKDINEMTVAEDASKIEIVIGTAQKILQFGEGALEAMPQVILQAAFIIRSANDSRLRAETPIFLIIFSLIASVISVANKYRWMDDDGMDDVYRGFKPKLKFPGCINYWYLLAAIWRYCHIITRFVVFSLVWGVCGGHWIGIYCAISYLFCMMVYVQVAVNDGEKCCFAFGLSLFLSWMFLPGLPTMAPLKPSFSYFGPRWFDNLIGYTLIAIFATLKFECNICTDAEFRQFGQNSIIDVLFIIGCCTYILDLVLLIPLWKKKIIGDNELLEDS